MPTRAEYLGMPLLVDDVDTDNAAFFRYCANGEFRLQRSRESGLLRYPPAPTCPWTGDREFEWARVDGIGTVHSYAEVHHAIQPAFRDKVPYMVLIVDLDEQLGVPTPHEALRVTGNLVTPDGSRAAPDLMRLLGIGTRVKMVLEPVSDDIGIPQWIIDPDVDQPPEPWRYPETR